MTKTRRKKRVPKIVSYLCRDPQQNRHRRHDMIHENSWCYCVKCGFTSKFHGMYDTTAFVTTFQRTKFAIVTHSSTHQFDRRPFVSRFPSIRALMEKRSNTLRQQYDTMNKAKKEPKIKGKIPKKLPKKIAKPLSDLNKAIKKDEKALKKNPNKIPKTLGKALEKGSKQLEKVKPKALPKDTPKTKKCTKCKKIKKVSEFGTRNVRGKLYLQSQCIECR